LFEPIKLFNPLSSTSGRIGIFPTDPIEAYGFIKVDLSDGWGGANPLINTDRRKKIMAHRIDL